MAVSDCRTDPRFAARIAAGTGYVPYTMLVVPLMRDGRPIGVLSLLGSPRRASHYGPDDAERAALFAELAVSAIEAAGEALPSLGARRPRVSPGPDWTCPFRFRPLRACPLRPSQARPRVGK